jgi:hypothetical protein
LRDSVTDEALMDWVLVDKRSKQEDVDVMKSCDSIFGSDYFLVVAKMFWDETRGRKVKGDQ